MKPRELRHRLEKSAKLLVTIQKHLPDVEARFADDKAEAGQVIVSTHQLASSEAHISKLGVDLENKGYKFKKMTNKWLGNIIYQGYKPGQPDLLIEVETHVNRFNHAEDGRAQPFSFKS